MATYTPNYNLGKPETTDQFGYNSFLPLFNDNMDKIDQIGGGGDNANQNIAENYDDTLTYTIGDYVIYDGLLYKCIADVTTAETFDPTKWTHVVVTDEMGSGGGGGSYTSDVLFTNSGTSVPSTISLSKGMSRYDVIVFSGYREQYQTYWSSRAYLASEISAGKVVGLVDDAMYAWYTVTDDTTLTLAPTANIVIDKVYGLKFNRGGSGDLSAHELTQDEYDDLTQAEKESETDVYFINDVVREEIVTPVDVTRWQNTYEQNMSISVQNDLLTYSYLGGANIGAFSIYQVQIPADATKIRFKITTGTSYSDTLQRFYICVGVKNFNSTNPTPFPDPTYDNTWIKYVSYNTRNSVIDGELDISDVDDACYLYFSAHGWTLTINEMDIVTEQETSETVRKIMYIDSPYADADTSYLTVVDGELNITFEEE